MMDRPAAIRNSSIASDSAFSIWIE